MVDAKIVRNAHWVCFQCGTDFGKGPKMIVSTWHENTCDICGRKKHVTEFRDFGYAKPMYLGEKCRECNGLGYKLIISNRCEVCLGTGYFNEEEEFEKLEKTL